MWLHNDGIILAFLSAKPGSSIISLFTLPDVLEKND